MSDDFHEITTQSKMGLHDIALLLALTEELVAPGPAGTPGPAGPPGPVGATGPRPVRSVVQRGTDGRIARIRQYLSDGSIVTQLVKRDAAGVFTELVEAEGWVSG
jgi:hypothetical protein